MHIFVLFGAVQSGVRFTVAVMKTIKPLKASNIIGSIGYCRIVPSRNTKLVRRDLELPLNSDMVQLLDWQYLH